MGTVIVSVVVVVAIATIFGLTAAAPWWANALWDWMDARREARRARKSQPTPWAESFKVPPDFWKGSSYGGVTRQETDAWSRMYFLSGSELWRTGPNGPERVDESEIAAKPMTQEEADQMFIDSFKKGK